MKRNVKFYYNGNAMALSKKAKEVAGFYACVLDNECTTRTTFNNNLLRFNPSKIISFTYLLTVVVWVCRWTERRA